MKMPRAIAQPLTAAALALAIIVPSSFTAPTPAQAGLDACVSLATDFGLDDVKKAASFVANHGECLGDLTNPSFLAVVAAVILIESTTSAYSDGDSCNAALGGVAGKPIAAALAALSSALGLPDSVKSELESFGSDQGAQGLIDFMNATPGLNIVSNNWSCACAVRYSGVAETLAKIVKDTLSCTGGILESGTDAIGNFFEGWGEAVQGTGLTPGVQEEQENYVTIYPCDGGWVNGTQYQPGAPYYNNSCWCPEPSKEVSNYSGDKFTCRCPTGQGYKYGQCKKCPDTSIVGSDGTCKPCAAGQKASGDSKSCVPTCGSGAIFLGGVCLGCDPGLYAETPSNTSVGACKKCPEGTTSKKGANAGAGSCYSVCRAWETWNPDTKSCRAQCGTGEVYSTPKEFGFSCAKCDANTYLDETTNSCEACPEGTTSEAGSASCKPLCDETWDYWDTSTKSCKPRCGPGSVWEGTSIKADGKTVPKCRSCVEGREYNHATNQCNECPKNMTWGKDASGVGVCMCPEGFNRQGVLCVPNGPIGNPKPNDGPLTPTIPQGAIEAPKNCPMGWGWSVPKKKCLPGLRDAPPAPQRDAPPPADTGRSAPSPQTYRAPSSGNYKP